MKFDVSLCYSDCLLSLSQPIDILTLDILDVSCCHGHVTTMCSSGLVLDKLDALANSWFEEALGVAFLLSHSLTQGPHPEHCSFTCFKFKTWWPLASQQPCVHSQPRVPR